MKNLLITVTMGMYIITTGCFTIPPADPYWEKTALDFITEPSISTVYVIRPNALFFGRGELYSVVLDANVIGALQAGNYLFFSVEPGKHQLRIDHTLTLYGYSGAPGRPVNFTAEPGKIYFFKADGLKQLSEEDGRQLVRSSELTGANLFASRDEEKWHMVKVADSYDAYDYFLRAHKLSKHAADATKKLVSLRPEHEKSQIDLARIREGQLRKFNNYNELVLTEDQFLKDGWNTVDPCKGKLGIVAFLQEHGKTTYFIGIHPWEKWVAGIGNACDERAGLLDRCMADASEGSHVTVICRPVSEIGTGKILDELTGFLEFEDRVLTKRRLVNR